MYRVFIIAMLFSLKLSALSESIQSGKWGSATTWSTGVVPSASDSVLIRKAHEVSLSQVNNECADLVVRGKIYCSSSGRNLTCNKLTLLDSGSAASSILGSISVNTFIAKGINKVEGFNLKVHADLIVDSLLSFSRTSGTIEIQNLVISAGGTWKVPDNQSFLISGRLENNGQFISGTGKYTFQGTNSVGGSTAINLVNASFTDTLLNEGRLQIGESISAPDSAIFINENSGVLVIKTTDANFKVKQLDLTATGNTIILSRGTKQHLPLSIQNGYQNISIANGELVVDVPITLNLKLIVDSLAVLTIKEKISLSPTADFIMKNNSVLNFSNDVNHQFNEFVNGFSNAEADSLNEVVVVSNIDFDLPVFGYGKLALNSNVPIHVNSEGNQIIRSDLKLDKDVTFNLNQQQLVINGNAEGTGKLSMLNAAVKYQGKTGQKILASDYDTLIIDNSSSDTSVAIGVFSVKTLHIQQGKVKLGSLTIKGLTVENQGEVLLGSVNFETSESLINKGLLTITSNGANCTFKGLLFNSGKFINSSSSDHRVYADVINMGVFQGCFGTGCTWSIMNTIKLSGSSPVQIPRIEINDVDTIYNKGSINISSSIKGKGTIINLENSKLTLGMNNDQNEAVINAWEHLDNTVEFNKNGDQNLYGVQLNTFQNLIASNTSHLRAIKDFNVNGDLVVDSNTILNVGGNKLNVESSSRLYLNKNSTMILGNSLALYSTVFPINYQRKNLFIDSTSTISYESQGNQIISSNPVYGNLRVKDGAVTKSIKEVGKGDSLIVRGGLNITESSIRFMAGNKVVKVFGDWEGPGHVKFTNGSFILHGNANSTGSLILGQTPVYYIGSGNQRMKNAVYHNLTIDKPSGTASIDAANGMFLVRKTMNVINGKVQVGGEIFEVQDSLVLSDTLVFKSRVQDKIFKNIYVSSTGYLNNAHGIDMHIKGNVNVQGGWQNGNRSTVYISDSAHQSIEGHGLITFGKLVLKSAKGGKVITLIGEFQVNDSLVLDSSSVMFDSATIKLDLNAALHGESEQNQLKGTGGSIIKSQLQLNATVHENIAGLGYSIYNDSAFGSGVLTRGFDAVILPNGELSISKTFLLELKDSSQQTYQTTISYFDYELLNHDQNLLTTYYDNDYSDQYRIGFSTLHSQFNKVAYSGVKTGAKITLGDIDVNPLPVQLLSFEAKLNKGQNGKEVANIAWKVGSEINTAKYLIYVSEDGINYSLMKEVEWKKGSYSGNDYSFDNELKTTADQLYYKLYEQDLYGEISYLGIDTIQRDYTVSVITINGQLIILPVHSAEGAVTVYDLNGKQLMNLDQDDLNLLLPYNHRIVMLCMEGSGISTCKKVYLK